MTNRYQFHITPTHPPKKNKKLGEGKHNPWHTRDQDELTSSKLSTWIRWPEFENS
jgi:hypothetical protein